MTPANTLMPLRLTQDTIVQTQFHYSVVWLPTSQTSHILPAAFVPRTPCPPLYGPLPLTLHKDGLVTGEGPVYAEIEALEARLSKRLGVEARRVVYFYILPQFNIMVPLLR